jgi:hypothetical protein
MGNQPVSLATAACLARIAWPNHYLLSTFVFFVSDAPSKHASALPGGVKNHRDNKHKISNNKLHGAKLCLTQRRIRLEYLLCSPNYFQTFFFTDTTTKYYLDKYFLSRLIFAAKMFPFCEKTPSRV